MKIPEFLKVSEKVREILYGDNVCCREYETLYYDEYLLDNPQNETALDKIVSSKGIQLVVAKPGAGKSVSLLKALNKLVDSDDSYSVVAVFPTRGLGEQMAVEDGVDQLLGGDDFNEESRIVASVYEKIKEIKALLYKEKSRGRKLILLLDEAHILTTHMNLRKEAIASLIRDIEKHLFENVIMVTATPEPLSLFHCDRITCFESRNQTPFIEEIQIVEVDDVRGYIESLDYGKEFPFIRLCDLDLIEEITKDKNSFHLESLTANDKGSRLYNAIVNEGKIEACQGMNGILTTNLLEAGISVTDFPDNIVPVFACPNYFISLDDMEQFFNRLRKSAGRTLKCARVVLPKRKADEAGNFKVSSFKTLSEILEWNDKVLHAFEKKFYVYLDAMEQVRQKDGSNTLPDELLKCFALADENLIQEWTNCCMKRMGELESCLSFQNHKIQTDKRMSYAVSYSQFQRQYYFNHELLKEELEQRMGTKTVILQSDTEKKKRKRKQKLPHDKEPIWSGLEDVQSEIQNGLKKNSIAFQEMYIRDNLFLQDNLKLREIFDYLLSCGLLGQASLKIMVNSRDMKEVKQYAKAYEIIVGNQVLERVEALDRKFVSVYSRQVREKLQIATAYYVQETGKQSIRINDKHIQGIEDTYVQLFGSYKIPTKLAVKRLLLQMYKIKEVKKDGTVILETKLITNVNEIFKK